MEYAQPKSDSGPHEAHGEIFEVKSIEEAIELAIKFKRNKRYDWFRGQTRQWLPRPSMARVATAAIPKAQKQLVRFFTWLKRTPGMKRFIRNTDHALAIAQHYGMPTTLLDFTTSPAVAGYFAASSNPNPNNTGCIYCLNTTDLDEFWTLLRKCSKTFQSSAIDFIRPKLPDLWRLEAQHGVFLYGPMNWSDVYPPDRIIFPQSGLPPYPSEEDVYPQRKSQLELLLDHYFHLDSFSGWENAVRSMFPEAKIFHVKGPPNRVEAKFFTRGTLPSLPCWKAKQLKQWQGVKEERLRTTAVGEIGLRLDLKSDAKILRARAAFGVRQALEINPTLRQKAVRWILLPQKRLNAQLSASLDRLWNGMRVLPYSNRDIAEAVGLCFALNRLGFSDADKDKAQGIAETLIGKTAWVEFGSWDGSSARGFASAIDLRAAVRRDINKHLLLKYRDTCRSVEPLLQLCSSPSRLFPFAQFVHIFGRQLIPCQVLQSEGSPAFFSPARLEAFGLP